MNKTIFIVSIVFVFGIGFLWGAFSANVDVSPVQADPQDETPGAMNYYPYYGGLGMGMGGMRMGMGMMGPMYGYGMNNYSYYGGYGMRMGMGMMGSMYGYGMYGEYPYYGNETYYGNYGYGYCPGCGGCGGYGMYGGSSYYYNTTSPSMNMTSTSAEGNVVSLSDDVVLDNSGAESAQATFAFSPLTIAGLGVSFLAFAPISWKILHRRTRK